VIEIKSANARPKEPRAIKIETNREKVWKGPAMMTRILSLALLCVLSFTLITSATADDKGDKKKKEKEWKKLQEQQKGKLRQKKNPLKKILELLKDVENRLVDADTGEWTQEEQRRIIEALNLQRNAKKALDKLIEDIQKAQSQSQSQSSKSKQKKEQSKKDQQGQGKKRENETPEQRRKRQERERKEQQKRKQQQKQKELEKQAKKKPEQGKKKKPENGQLSKKEQAKRAAKLRKEQLNALKSKKSAVQPWGNLPLKLHQDVEKARREEVPEKYRDIINGYRKRINDD
jgi:hypothetical protein